MSQPRVLLEISVLGFAAQSAAFRTGVFRMVDAWAQGLAQSPLEHLSFGSFLDVRTALRTRRYWKQTAVLSTRPFVPEVRASWMAEVDQVLLDLNQKQSPMWAVRGLRRLLNESLHVWEKSNRLSSVDLAPFDVFHSTYWPFPKGSRNTKTRHLMTFVDLINLVNAELSTDGGAFFREVLGTLQSDDFTVSISESTRRDLLTVRPDLDPKKCFVVPLAASDNFRPQPKDALLYRLQKWDLRPASYFLSVCTLERRKNLPRLLDAFESWSSLPGSPRLELVLTGAGGNALAAIHEKVRSSKVKDRIRLLGFVDDNELPALYQGAAAFVYPSLYEGFGLPVLEALQCGAVVVTSNNSSLPEVAGAAALYCDATSKDSLVAALQSALKVTSSSAWREGALKQADRFSWEKSVAALQSIYGRMLDL